MIRSTAPDQWLIDTQSISGDCFTYHFRRDQKAEVSWRIVDQWRAGLLIKAEADALLLAVYDVTTARPIPCPTLKDRLLSACRAVCAVGRMIVCDLCDECECGTEVDAQDEPGEGVLGECSGSGKNKIVK
jgi:hypothetical protein